MGMSCWFWVCMLHDLVVDELLVFGLFKGFMGLLGLYYCL